MDFIYRFITMNTSPFKAMKAIYVYIAALVGLALLASGLYGLVEHLIEVLLTSASFTASSLVGPFTSIIIGLFVMVPHWAVGHHFHMKEHSKK